MCILIELAAADRAFFLLCAHDLFAQCIMGFFIVSLFGKKYIRTVILERAQNKQHRTEVIIRDVIYTRTA